MLSSTEHVEQAWQCFKHPSRRVNFKLQEQNTVNLAQDHIDSDTEEQVFHWENHSCYYK